MSEIKFEEQCNVRCTDSGISHIADIHKFKENEYIEIIIHGVIVSMKYNNRSLYVGSKFGMEFTTVGPKNYILNRK